MRGRTLRWFAILGALIVSVVILWVDIATGLWQEYVILAGLAAGLVTFVLTTLVVDRIIARATEVRWKPVTRLALTDILHAIADEERSEVARDRIVPRLFEPLGSAEPAELSRLRDSVFAERTSLARTIASWSVFLAQSADAVGVLDHAALLAEALDRIRDASIEAQAQSNSVTGPTQINGEIARYNDALTALVAELRRAIHAAR